MLAHVDLIGVLFSFVMGLCIGVGVRRRLWPQRRKDHRPTNGAPDLRFSEGTGVGAVERISPRSERWKQA